MRINPMTFVNMANQSSSDARTFGWESYKPVQKVSGVWYDNGERYATADAAHKSALSRFHAWTMPEACGVAGSEDAPNRDA